MKKWNKWCMALAFAAGMTPSLRAQAPATPLPASGAQAATSSQTLWKFLGLSKDNLAGCKAKFCQSQLGQMVNNGLKPVSAFSGGLVPGCCPAVNPADLAKPPDSAEGAAARIKQDEAAAKARRQAVRYLGTVDCSHWPEALDGLINALRADRNECVRMEAAYALNSGCCCNKKTIKALTICVAGTDEDGNPPENCERVRMAALVALTHCLACVGPETKPPEAVPEAPRPEPPLLKEGVTGDNSPQASGTPAATAAIYYQKVQTVPLGQITASARQVVAACNQTPPRVVQPYQGHSGLFGIVMSSVSQPSRAVTATVPNQHALSDVGTRRPATLARSPSLGTRVLTRNQPALPHKGTGASSA